IVLGAHFATIARELGAIAIEIILIAGDHPLVGGLDQASDAVVLEAELASLACHRFGEGGDALQSITTEDLREDLREPLREQGTLGSVAPERAELTKLHGAGGHQRYSLPMQAFDTPELPLSEDEHGVIRVGG